MLNSSSLKVIKKKNKKKAIKVCIGGKKGFIFAAANHGSVWWKVQEFSAIKEFKKKPKFYLVIRKKGFTFAAANTET